MIVEPKPEFQALDEATILAALDDPDPENPIAKEVARLVTGYTENFKRHVERLGYMPASVLHVKPQSAIEGVAMRLVTSTIKAAVNKRKN